MEIPEELFNSDTGRPFESCLVCERNLAETGEPYFIEKFMRRLPDLDVEEVLFEYAMCMACAQDMRQQLSRESLERMEAYFREHAPSEMPGDASTTGDRFEKCLFSGQEISECREFAYHGMCMGNELFPAMRPYAISEHTMDELGELLSDKTIEGLDDFKGKYFTGPPEISKLISPKRLVTF